MVCLVIDEAHKAKGDYHFCVAVRLLAAESRFFRVLALSASPGNSLASVQQVSLSSLFQR